MRGDRYRFGLVAFFAFCLILGASGGVAQAAGSISLTGLGDEYKQDFNTLASSGTGTSSDVPTGWHFVETGTNGNSTYTAGNGSSNIGDTYSFGTTGSSERAFGCLLSGSLTPRLGVEFVNNTGRTIQALVVSYTGEQWRLGATGRQDRLDFQLSATATPGSFDNQSNSVNWTDYDPLDFLGPQTTGTVGALDGNAAANRTELTYTITGLNIPDGSTFRIRWLDFNASGADDGMAVDDFSLIPWAIPDDISLSNASVLEEEPAGATVGNFSTDPDFGGPHVYTLVSGAGDTDNDFFTIDGNVLKTAAQFDYEVQNSYSIRVRTTDSRGFYFEKVFAIAIEDIFDPPSGEITLAAIGAPHSEDFDSLAPNGSSGTVPLGWYFLETGGSGDSSTYVNTAYRADDGSSNFGDTYSYGEAGSSERAFGCLRSNRLVPILGAQFVNDTGHSIHALDISYVGEQWRTGADGREADRLEFQLSTDATALNTGSWTTHESLTFYSPVIATAGALDGNADGNRELLSGLITGLDIPDGDTFWIRWVDADVYDAQDGLAVDDFSLTPYTSPTALSLSNSSVEENQPAGTTVGDFSTIDPDSPGPHTYTLVSGTGDTDNDSFTIDGNVLKTAAQFDYEVKDSYRIRVRTTDSVGLHFEESFTIYVIDVNEAPSITSNGGGATAALSVPENTTLVTTVTGTDPDGDTLTFSISGGADAAKFAINSVTGVLVFITAPDFEHPTDADADNVYEVTVQVGDGLLIAGQSLRVTVTDVGETPTTHTLVYIAGAGGSILGKTEQVVEHGGDGTKVTAVPKPGYHFYMWSDGLTVTSRVEKNVTADKTVKALFLRDEVVKDYTLSYTSGIGGSIIGDRTQVVRQGGSGTEVTAVPYSGYRFVGWSDGVATAARTDTNVRADLNLVAEFAPIPDRWTDISNQQWLDTYGVTAVQVDVVADGYSDGTFRPSLAITRAQFCKMALDGFGVPPMSPPIPNFVDIPAAHHYYAWIEGAFSAHMVVGYPDGRFRPDQSITRRQANSVLGRYLSDQEFAASGHISGEKGTYASVAAWYEAEGSSVLARFIDASDVGSMHAPYTAYLVHRGVVTGDGARLMPASDLSRAQAAVLIVRIGLLGVGS